MQISTFFTYRLHNSKEITLFERTVNESREIIHRFSAEDRELLALIYLLFNGKEHQTIKAFSNDFLILEYDGGIRLRISFDVFFQ